VCSGSLLGRICAKTSAVMRRSPRKVTALCCKKLRTRREFK